MMQRREIWLPDKVDEIGFSKAQEKGIDVSTFYAGLISDHVLGGESAGAAHFPSPSVGEASDASDPITVGIVYETAHRVAANPDHEVAGFIRDPNDPDRPYDECDYGYFVHVGEGKGEYVNTDNTGEDFECSPPVLGTFEKYGAGHGDYDITTGFSHLRVDVAKIFPGFPIRSIRYAQRVVNEATGILGVVASEHKNKAGQKIGVTFKPNFMMIEALLQRKSGIRVSLYGEPDRFKNKPDSLRRGRGKNSRIVVQSDEELENLLPLIRQAYKLKLGRRAESEFASIETIG